MKILNNIVVAAFCAATISCVDLKPLEDEVADLKDQIAQLRGQCASMNESIDALSVVVDALAKSDFVTSVQNTSGADGQGFVITFVNSPTVTVWIPNQEDAVCDAPVVSVKLGPDGVYYWAADGEFVLDQDGQKVPVAADGLKPELKIEGGNWYVSYDGGATWEFLAVVQVPDVDGYLFSDVDLSDPSKVVITLSDGQKITLPVAMDGLLSLDTADGGASYRPGDQVTVNYSALKSISVVVDDSDVASSQVIKADAFSGVVHIQTRNDVSLNKQRAFLIFYIEGCTAPDWRMISFDASGKVIISDIK